MNSSGKIIIAIFMALLATALTGKVSTPVGIHSQCEDGIDNDSDSDIDIVDTNCFDYPFADGGGEYTTTTGVGGKAWSSSSYSISIWEYHYNQGYNSDPAWCSDYSLYIASYNLLFTESGGKDTSGQDYTNWKNQNCP
jgi:hypothetical protein